MAESELFDVLIVSGGFSGLAAAVTLARQLHTAVVFDSGSYRNARSRHMHLMPAWDHQDPERFRASARADLESLIASSRVASPAVAQISYIYTDGDETLAAELKGALKDAERYRVDHRPISKLSPDATSEQLIKISFQDGSEDKGEAFLGHSPFTRVKGPFAEQLGLELTPMGDYVVSPPFNATSMEGVFAAGDCATMFKIATNAVASGSLAGAGVPSRLREEQMGMKQFFWVVELGSYFLLWSMAPDHARRITPSSVREFGPQPQTTQFLQARTMQPAW
ncbi:hypothetical protein DL768_009793 [Monosporascus sp. mg162]|nr:hypothetical protein DL768_009793 [Monosporascus sp. mg162]